MRHCSWGAAPSMRWPRMAGLPCIPRSAPVRPAANPSSRWIRKCSATIPRAAGVHPAAVLARFFICPTSSAERGLRRLKNRGLSGRRDEREICQSCHGTRLNAIARAVRLWNGTTIVDLSNASVDAALAWLQGLRLKGREAEIARDILPEIRERLKFLREVGLGYLQLGRGATTLSGGEAQRIRLAAQLGSNLSGVLYILDEPTIGLHARDNEKLLHALELLKARGNSLLVVEHDEETMRRADYIIDLGPGAGVNGGEVVASGTWKELMAHAHSVTAQCLRSRKSYPARGRRRPVVPNAEQAMLTLAGAKLHNLKNLTVSFPLHRFVCLTGVSGSGKSTLLRDCLLPVVRARISPTLDIQVLHIESVIFDKFSARFDIFAHEGGEDGVGLGEVFQLDLKQSAAVGVHGRLPELRGRHLAQALVTWAGSTPLPCSTI